jgi:hypothetical protein
MIDAREFHVLSQEQAKHLTDLSDFAPMYCAAVAILALDHTELVTRLSDDAAFDATVQAIASLRIQLRGMIALADAAAERLRCA